MTRLLLAVTRSGCGDVSGPAICAADATVLCFVITPSLRRLTILFMVKILCSEREEKRMARFLRFQVAWICHSFYSDASHALYRVIKPVSSSLMCCGRHLDHMCESDVVAISCGSLEQNRRHVFWKRMRKRCLSYTKRSSLCGRRPARQPWA